MKKIEVQVLLREPETGEPKLYAVPGYQSSVPGLVIHHYPIMVEGEVVMSDGWNVTHQASGGVLPWGAGYDRRKDAEEYAQACSKLADWTLPTGEEVRATSVKDTASIMVNKHNEILWR